MQTIFILRARNKMDEMQGGQKEAWRLTPGKPHKTTTQPTKQFAILLRALSIQIKCYRIISLQWIQCFFILYILGVKFDCFAESKIIVNGHLSHFSLELSAQQISLTTPESNQIISIQDCNRRLIQDWFEEFKPQKISRSLDSIHPSKGEQSFSMEGMTYVQFENSKWTLDSMDEMGVRYQGINSRWFSLVLRQEKACQLEHN